MLTNIIFLLGICSSLFSLPQISGKLTGISVMIPIFQYENSKTFTVNSEWMQNNLYDGCKIIYKNDTSSTDSLMSIVHLKSSSNEECDGDLTFTLKDEFGYLSRTSITLPCKIVEKETSNQIESKELITDENLYCFDKLISTIVDSEYTQSVRICIFNISESMEVLNNENNDDHIIKISTGYLVTGMDWVWLTLICFIFVCYI